MESVESLRTFLFYTFWVLFYFGFVVGIYLYNPDWKSYLLGFIGYFLFICSVGYFRADKPNIIEYIHHVWNGFVPSTANGLTPQDIFGGIFVAIFLGHCAGNFAQDVGRIYVRLFRKNNDD